MAVESTEKEELQNKISNSSAAEGLSFYGDAATVGGELAGLEMANQLYGMNTAEIGSSIQDIVARRKAAMEGNDPASTMARSSRNADLRAAQAQGMTPAQVAQLRRSGTQQAAAQDYASQQAATADMQSLMGNIAGGTMQSRYAQAQLSNAQNSDSSSGTVICTEMFRQGYMDKETYRRDQEYGRLIRLNDPYVYIGYIFLASPIVKIMKKSDVFTYLISIPAMAWANDMAYSNSFAGKIINKTGSFICRLVGKAISKKGVQNA